MYAVIETGGKQYRVELGSELAVERLDALPGSTVDFDRVLLVADGDDAQVGTPTVADALVTADVLRQDRGEKLIVFKYRPKARHRSKKGHRQEQTVLRIADIRFNGRSAADEAGSQKKDQQAERKQAQAEADKKAAADQALAAKLAADAAKARPADAATEAKPAKTSTRKTTAKTADETTDSAPDAKQAAPEKTTKSTAKASTKSTDAAADDKPADDKPKTTRPRTTRSSTKKDE
jgi:large subunit ribosomal protein L21